MSINLSAIKDAIDGQNEAFELFKKTNDERVEQLKNENASLRDRIEEIESRNGHPRGTSANDPNKNRVKRYFTASGEFVDIPHDVKLADVFPATVDRPVTFKASLGDEHGASEISFDRWLGAVVAREYCQDKKAVDYVLNTKQLTTGTSGLQIPNQYVAEWIDRLRAQMVLSQCGMITTVMLDKTQTRTALINDPSASWHTESSSISAANPTFAERKLTAQTLVTRCQATVELSQDSPDFGAQLAQAMSKSMAAELDRAGLNGSGTPPEPLGLIGTAGIGSVSGGSISDYSKFIDGVKTLLTAGVPLEIATRNVVFNPYVWAKLQNLATGIASDKSQLPLPRCFETTNFRVTTQIPDESPISTTAVLGDFSMLLMGVRKEASVEVLKLSDYAGKLVLDFLGYLRGDFIVLRPASFCKVTALA